MIPDPRDWNPEKPQCIHHNDADNCYACGTGRTSNAYNVQNLQGSEYTVPDPGVCVWHGKRDCNCIYNLMDAVQDKLEETRRAEVSRINEVSNRIWRALDAQRHAHAWPEGGKCKHGIYISQHYCGFCSIEIIEPEYDRNKYRAEINKALSKAKVNFRATGYYPGKDDKERLKEDEKNFQDLLQLVDLEVWKASRHYGEKMNGALAADIAKKTAGKFTHDIIEETTVVTDIAWDAMPPDFRERASEVFTRVGGLSGLVRLSKDDRADPNDRSTAVRILNEYGFRAPRFESVDVPAETADGDANLSVVEVKYPEKLSTPPHAGNTTDDENFQAYRPALELLVRSWRGDMRRVGEMMLAGTFNVREVPGVSKSNASRLYQKVVAAFRARIAREPK